MPFLTFCLTYYFIVQTNIALIHNNARVGAQLACALSCAPGVEVIGVALCFSFVCLRFSCVCAALAAGGLGEDIYFQAGSGEFVASDSNPGRHWRTAGGVGRNVAVCVARLAHAHGAALSVALCSAVGDDASGKRLLDELRAESVDTGGCVMLPSVTTASCTRILPFLSSLSPLAFLCIFFCCTTLLFSLNQQLRFVRWCNDDRVWTTHRCRGGHGHL